MNVVASIVLCLVCFAAGYLVGSMSSEKSCQKMVEDQKKKDDDVINTLEDYINNHIDKDTEGKV